MLGRLLIVKYDTLFRSCICLRYRDCMRNFNAKIAMPDLQLYSCNINLIQNTWKILSFSCFTFAEKSQIKINSLMKQKHGYLIQT